MCKFEPGDIVEIALPEEHAHSEWNGLTIEIISYAADEVLGKVLKTAIPDWGYPINSKISWCFPSSFTHVIATTNETPKEKYQSPFSGRWE